MVFQFQVDSSRLGAYWGGVRSFYVSMTVLGRRAYASRWPDPSAPQDGARWTFGVSR